MAESTLITFIELLRKSQLLGKEQLDQVAELQTRFPEAKALAKELIRRGWLTAYQINQISQGKGKDLILGQYVLQERLGEGGMGQVFKARHLTMGRIVALKVIRKDRLSNPDAIRRFQREIQAAGKLSHRNVVIAYDAAEINGTHFFAMEYVEGTDLAKLVKQSGPLPLGQACDYIYQAALGLQHAHECGMVHRDIKPANFLVTHATGSQAGPQGSRATWGVVKILDMGLARIGEADWDSKQSTLTHDGKVVGTPDYIAPEQARDSHTADIRADLYSLGCTFYVLLAGRVPFPGGSSVMEKLMKHQVEDPVPIESLRPDVPPGIREILKKLITRRPEDRYQIPAELAAALEPFVFRSHQDSRSSAGIQSGLPFNGSAQSATLPAMSAASSATGGLSQSQGGAGRLLLRGIGLVARSLLWLTVLLVGPGPTTSRRVMRLALASILLMAGVLIGVAVFQSGRKGSDGKGRPGELSKHPFDGLDPAKIPEEQRLAQQPAELMGLVGEPRGRHWAPVFSHYPQSINRIVFSPDGRLVASVSSYPNATVHVWDTATLRELAGMPTDETYPQALGFAADSHSLVMMGSTGQVKIWDTHKRMGTLLKGYNITPRTVSLSPDGKTAAILVIPTEAGKPRSIQILDIPTGATRHTIGLAERNPNSMSLSHNGKILAAFLFEKGATTLKIWELEPALKERASVANLPFLGLAPMFSPDDKLLGIVLRGSLKILNAEAGQEVQAVNNLGNASYYALSPDFKTLAVSAWTGGAMQVSLWDVDRGNVRHKLPDISGVVVAMQFSPDGKTLATSGQTSGIKLWNVDIGKERVALKKGSGGFSASMVFSPDSKTLITGGAEMTLRSWNVRTGDESPALKPRNMPVTLLAILPESNKVAIGTGEIEAGKVNSVLKLWDPTTDQEEILIRDRSGAAGYWDYDPSQKLYAAACFIVEGGNTVPVVKLWNAEGKEQNPLTGLPARGRISCLAFSGAGTTGSPLLAAGVIAQEFGAGGSIALWDLTTGKERGSLKVVKGQPHTVAFAPDGQFLAALSGFNQDSNLKLYDLAANSEKELADAAGQTTQVASLAFAPGGKLIATGSHQTKEDRTIALWDYSTGAVQKTLSGHKAQVQALAFSTDGTLLVSSSLDGQIIIWNATSGAKLHQWSLPGPALRMRFTSDSRHLLTGNANGTVAVFKLPGETAAK